MPLQGVSVALKANICAAGFSADAGTAGLRDWKPAHDAEVVSRLRAVGALIAGMAPMHELAMGWTGQNEAFGDAEHPEAPERMAGGSSGGSACAVATGAAAMALGTDTNGSVRVPAAFCGIAGLRPSHGRYPMQGVVPLAPSLDTVGPMARRVEQLALLDAVLAGETRETHDGLPAPSPDTLRLGWCRSAHWEPLEDDVAFACEQAMRRLASAGVTLVPVELPDWPDTADPSARHTIAFEARTALPAFFAAQAGAPPWSAVEAQASADLQPALRAWHEAGLDDAYRAAVHRRERLRSSWDALTAKHRLDALVYPAVRVVAPLRVLPRVSPGPDIPVGGMLFPARLAFAHNLGAAALGGWPSLVVPAGRGRTSGLPVALAFDGLPGRDLDLLALGATLQPLIDLH